MRLEYDAAVLDRDVEVSFTVDVGETVALLGPNGAGKSTVLSVVAGLLRPDRGRVVLGSRVLTQTGESRSHVQVPPHQRHVAMLAQEPLLFPHLSVRDNVAFGPRSAGAGRHGARTSAERWLHEVGAADLAARRPGRLSGGQAQRVALARALAAEPALLLLDEPLAAVDVAVAPGLRQTLRRLLADRTAVVVTHDVLDALLLADRVVVLDGGAAVEEGPVADVLRRPRSAFAARIAGLNMVRGTWRDGAVQGPGALRVEGRTDDEPVDGDAVVAVFRPTAVSIFRDRPGGSPRNVFDVTVTGLEPHGGHVRVRSEEISADVTPRAVAELDLAPGERVVFVVKATEVDLYRT